MIFVRACSIILSTYEGDFNSGLNYSIEFWLEILYSLILSLLIDLNNPFGFYLYKIGTWNKHSKSSILLDASVFGFRLIWSKITLSLI